MTVHFALLVTTLVCARLVFAGDGALRAAGNDIGMCKAGFLPVTMHFALLVKTVVCARLVFAGDGALRAAGNDSGMCKAGFCR